MELSSFLKINVNLVLPCFNKLTIDYEKDVYCFCETIIDHLCISDFFKNDSFSIFDHIKNTFELLDTIIDEEYRTTIGKNFTEKYDSLKKDTDFNIVFSQVYRLLITLRNTIVHSQKSLTINNDKLVIIRNDKKDIKLVVKNELINYILSYAIYCKNVQTIEINECYKINIALWYYARIFPLILEYKEDGNNINLIQTKNNTIFDEITPRYICESILYEKQENKIKFNIKHDYLFSSCKKNNCIDFVFAIDNRSYMIPFEIVQDGIISISKLKDFEFKGDIPSYVNKFCNGLMNKNNVI